MQKMSKKINLKTLRENLKKLECPKCHSQGTLEDSYQDVDSATHKAIIGCAECGVWYESGWWSSRKSALHNLMKDFVDDKKENK